MSWNYTDEVDNGRPGDENKAAEREIDKLVDVKEHNIAAEITENKKMAKTKDDKRLANITDNGNTSPSPKVADSDRLNIKDHVTDTCHSQETGHIVASEADNHRYRLLQSPLTVRRQQNHPAARAKEDLNIRRNVELAAVQSANPHGLPAHHSEAQHEDGKATVTRCILATSRFIWLPICQPSRGCRHSEAMDEALVAAAECVRWHVRRNALCDHMAMPLTQEARERIERDVANRKTSVTRKMSQYLKAAFNSSDYDVDLI